MRRCPVSERVAVCVHTSYVCCQEFIDDANAKKPADWDESAPEYVRDPNAVKPEDWNDEEDGPWMQPTM